MSGSDEGDGRVQERRRRHLHGGQGGAQVVGDRAHQCVPQAVDLLQQLGAKGLLPQLGPLERQGGMVGEGAEQGPVGLGGRHPPHGQDADRAARTRTGPRCASRAGLPAAVPRLTGTPERGSSWRELGG